MATIPSLRKPVACQSNPGWAREPMAPGGSRSDRAPAHPLSIPQLLLKSERADLVGWVRSAFRRGQCGVATSKWRRWLEASGSHNRSGFRGLMDGGPWLPIMPSCPRLAVRSGVVRGLRFRFIHPPPKASPPESSVRAKAAPRIRPAIQSRPPAASVARYVRWTGPRACRRRPT